MAPQGIPLVLAVEIQTGTTSSTQGLAGADSPHGPRESDLGSGAHCQ
jgi:hypothetical protein